MSQMEIVVRNGPSKGLVMSLRGRRSVTIGRAPTNVLVLRDEKVSSHHARLDMAPGGVILTDLGSKNGTFADAESIVGSRLITVGTIMTLGGSALELRERAAESESGLPSREPIRASNVPDLTTQRDLVLQPAAHGQHRNRTKAQRNLGVLIDVGELISSERDLERLLERLMDLIFEELPADRGSLLLLDQSGEPEVRVTRSSADARTQLSAIPSTILTKVLDGGVAILTADAGADARFSSGASIIAQRIRSAMCVPIRSKQRVLGAIYVDTMLSIGVFGEDDLHVLSTVGLLAGTAIQNIQLIEENIQQERMAAIGKVIAGLGHDIRNMLMALRGGMYLVDDTLKSMPDEDIQYSWNVVKNGHESIASLVQDMVNYSKPRDPEWRYGSVNDVVEAAAAFAREAARAKEVELDLDLDGGLQPFWFDPTGLERCVMNLLSNAVDAAPEGTGRVKVATEPGPNASVQIVVRDNGEGIPHADRDKIFDLLFSTKGKRGTGFGLAITHKIVEEHGGKIGFDSEVGEGTIFTIAIPDRSEMPGGTLDEPLHATVTSDR